MLIHLRRAFSLIETIVSISIIAVLLSLLLPAVQLVRSAAQKLDCQHRQRQLAFAVLNYESEHLIFPKGTSQHPRNPLFEYRSWQIDILRLLELNDIESAISQPLFDQVLTNFEIRGELAFQVLKPLVCPSNEIVITKRGAPTHYLGVNGKQGIFSEPTGILGINFACRTGDITDGLSNTILIMERPSAQEDICYAWFNPMNCYLTSATTGIYNAPVYSYSGISFGSQPYKKWNPTHYGSGFGPWSNHSGGSNFAFADGSVRFIRYSAGNILPAMATRAGGEVFDLP